MQIKQPFKFISIFTFFVTIGTAYADGLSSTLNGLKCEWKDTMIPQCWEHLKVWGDRFFEIRTAPCGPYVTVGDIVCKNPPHCNQAELYTQDDYTAPSLFASITLDAEKKEGTIKFHQYPAPETKITCSF